MNFTSTGLPPERLAELEIQALMGQLERMRGMQYHYHQKFFHWQLVSIGIICVLLFWMGPAAPLLVPFLVVTSGVQSAFYLHFCDFARQHAESLEQRLNSRFGKTVFVASELESIYFYKNIQPRISGLLPLQPMNFFSMFTLHWLMLWALLFFLGMFQGWKWLPESWQVPYIWIVITWAGINGTYIAGYNLFQRELRAVKNKLSEIS